MEPVQTTYGISPVIIAAFIAASLGSVFGALFKEQFSDIFYKRKRKREVKSELIRSIVRFFRALNTHIDAYNSSKIHTDRVNKLQSSKNIKGITDSDKATKNLNVKGLFDYIKKIQEDDSRIFKDLVQAEAEIRAFAIECSYYFKREQVRQLMKSVTKMIDESATEKHLVAGYKTLALDDLIVFQTNMYPVLLDNIIKENTRRMERTLIHFDEVLK